MKTQSENPSGLHLRYVVTKANGEPVDPRAEYFVLRLDRHAKDQRHVNACRLALMTYAAEVESFLPQLAADLRAKYGPQQTVKEDFVGCLLPSTQEEVAQDAQRNP